MTKAQKRIRDRMTEGVQAAVAHALEKHKRLGEPVAVWRSGKVVVLGPQQIPASPRRRRR
jgi:hypothetical protein